MLKGKKGFTLIELLIVMVIIGILIGIIAIASQAIIGRGSEAACEIEKNVVEVGIVSYFTGTYDEYPTEDGDVPGDIEWELIAEYLDLGASEIAPATDGVCDWQLDSEGNVFANMTEECPCGGE